LLLALVVAADLILDRLAQVVRALLELVDRLTHGLAEFG